MSLNLPVGSKACAALLAWLWSGCAYGQTLQPGKPVTAITRKDFVKQITFDERAIFSSPARLRTRDLKWLIPIGASTAFLLASDQRNMTERIKTNALAQQRSTAFSNGAVLSLAMVPTFLAWKGWREGNDYSRDTGALSSRALLDTLIATEILKIASSRQRPLANGSRGNFLSGSHLNSSFPSMHAASAWALASVLTSRYPGWLTQVAAYGMAGAVSFSRVSARQHFPADVVAGSALGFLIGRYVARQGQPPLAANLTQVLKREGAGTSGGSFVPLDNWMYPALDRLAAFGLIPSQISGLRPWSRSECLRQFHEAEALAASRDSRIPSEASDILAALHRELEASSGPFVLDSIYLRTGYINGQPLHNSLDFGQTWRNDSGRPFGSGLNLADGFTAHAESNHFFAGVQGEYQHSPGNPAYSLDTRRLIATLDFNPLQAATPQTDTNRFRMLAAYVGVRWSDFEFSIGKQSIWWGPTYDAPLSFSTNAEPSKSAKISTVEPFHLPGILGHLGEIRTELVVGKLGGQQYTWRPWFNAQKISFKLTENLEMGFTRWSILWGTGHSITAKSLARNLVSFSSPDGPTGVGGKDPGDRKGGFDFRYRVPGLRNWLTLYSDSYSDDDPSPLAAPRRAALSPGIYLTRIPGVERLSLRAEMASTIPMQGDLGGWFVYINTQYHSGNTNYGYLLGNPVGRDARAIQGWATYHLAPRNTIEAGYRQSKGGAQFLPNGSTQSDATVRTTFELKNNWHVSSFFQFERYNVPSIGAPQNNVSGWLQLTWEPRVSLFR